MGSETDKNKLPDDFDALVASGKSLLAEQLWDAPKAALLARMVELSGKSVVVITGGTREGKLFDDFSYFSSVPLYEFPAWETLPSEEIAPSPDIVGERFDVLRQLMHQKGACVVLCPLQAVLQRVVPPKQLALASQTIRVGDTILFDHLLAKLDEMGFVRRPIAADKGEYAVRGGIVDLFPVGKPDPYRIEFWGDEVESIRLYDPVGQKSVGHANEVTVTFAQEKIEDDGATLFDYLDNEVILVFDDLLAIEDRYVSLIGMPNAISRQFVAFDTFFAEVQSVQKCYFTNTPIEQLGAVVVDKSTRYYSTSEEAHPVTFEMINQQLTAYRWNHPFCSVTDYFGLDLIGNLSKAAADRLPLQFVTDSKDEERHLKEMLSDSEVPLLETTLFRRGYLSSGYVIEGEVALIPMPEFTHRHKVRRIKQRSTHHTPPSEFNELGVGELVVHLDNGIGRFLGTELLPNAAGVKNEYLSIEYADHGKLYVPLTQSHLVSRYIGSHEERPKLNTLGTTQWAKVRAKTEAAIRDYAAQLIKLHAERDLAGGYAFPNDGEEMHRFDRDFPYIETDDQVAAIAAVKADMSAPKPMDRLVCGDVGYGKTEVAMRAAFKAVEGGKQVVMLVPTTVLAMQHYENFCARMDNFAVNIGVLSRFRKPKEQKETIEKVATGGVDILIGTHRVLSKDIIFRDLGLVIVDEEQRFGVRVKEKIRAFKAGVDCLTLTATPIPRTLYLSLLGARDLSTINTPPQDRLPIKTVITEDDDKTIQNAILRELARDGQVFVVHNRVESIDRYVERIRLLVPKARIVHGHGQMSGEELDGVFHTFKSGETDILVATTIIENGIDIPNANTIIIDRADRYGLAELYQLRGRVGRWSKRAYAYFLTPARSALTEIAQARLDAMMQVGGYGGGMKLAMRDLEIRGAGNIVGVEQSGHMSKIGFNLYCRLLKQKINQLQGTGEAPLTETKLELPFDGQIPAHYVQEPTLRMEFYSRLGEATNPEQIDEIIAELHDRFGRPPEAVSWLQAMMRLRIFAGRMQITALKLKKYTLAIECKKGKSSHLVKAITTPLELEKQVLAALQKRRPA